MENQNIITELTSFSEGFVLQKLNCAGSHLLTKLPKNKDFVTVLDVTNVNLTTLKCHSDRINALEVDKYFKLEPIFHHIEKN